MKRCILIASMVVSGLTAPFFLNAQTGIPENCYFHFTGKADEKHTVELDLVKIGDSVYGVLSPVPNGSDFSYLSGNETFMPMNLHGKIDVTGNLKLKEDPWEKGVTLAGTLAGDRTFKGSWICPGEKSRFNFELADSFPAGTISFGAYYQQGVLPLVRKKDSPRAVFQFAYLSPNGPADPVINDSLKTMISEKYSGKQVGIKDPDMILESMKEDYFESYLETNRAMGASFDWESLKFMNIMLNCHYLLTFYTEQYSFTGGAHGLQTRDHCVVDLRTGKQVTPGDIFREGYEDDLTEILTRKLRESHNIDPDTKLTDSGFFVESVKPGSNFYLTINGIGFYYNHYEIAPYSDGPDDIFIPFREIRDLLLKDGIIHDLPGYSLQP